MRWQKVSKLILSVAALTVALQACVLSQTQQSGQGQSQNPSGPSGNTASPTPNPVCQVQKVTIDPGTATTFPHASDQTFTGHALDQFGNDLFSTCPSSQLIVQWTASGAAQIDGADSGQTVKVNGAAAGPGKLNLNVNGQTASTSLTLQ
jgi:hypothetical protein